MAAQEDKSLGGEATFAGRAAARPQRADVSLGDERTLGGGETAGLGTVVNDIEVVDLEARYKIEGTLGQGGMGAVLLAIDTRLDRKVAIKRILGEAARSKTAIMRFLTEAKSIAALNHPNIVQIYDYGRAQDGPFLIMEYVDGGSLLDLCKGTPLPIDRAVDLVCQLCDGLGAAHEQGIIHRDIKPANILINRAGLPKLTDFGLAKAEAADHGMTMAGAVMGTPDFMPPEQRRDASEVDHRSDLWSLAATFYQIVTGRSPKVIRLKEVPTPLHAVFEKALEDAKEQRFQSAGEFRDAICAAVGLGSDKASVLQGNLLEGQCSACGTISNDLGRKFCRQCQGALRTPCLQCDKDMPVWDAVCGECGGRQSEVAETRQASLIAKQQESKKAYKSYDFATAINIGEQLIALRHPQLVKFAEWGRTFVDAVTEQRSRLLASVEGRLQEARLHRQAFDYPAAIRAIESIPAALQDSASQGLLVECRNNRDEGAKLLKLIADRIKARDLEGLLPEVERAIAIQGKRADLQRLLAQMRAREEKRAERTSMQQSTGIAVSRSQEASFPKPEVPVRARRSPATRSFLGRLSAYANPTKVRVVAGIVSGVLCVAILFSVFGSKERGAPTPRGSLGGKSTVSTSVASQRNPVPVEDVVKPPPATSTSKPPDIAPEVEPPAPESPGLTVIDRTTASYEGGRRKESTVCFSDGSSARIIVTQGIGEPSVTVYSSDNGTPLRGTLACDISETSGRVVVTKDPSPPELKDAGIRAGATIEAISIENERYLIPLPTGNDEDARCSRLRLLRGKPGTSGTLRFRPGRGDAVKQLKFTWAAPSPKHPRNQPLRKEWTNSLGMSFVLVEPGEGTLGVLRGKPDESAHVVRLTRPILIATQEVTQAEFQGVMGSNPSCYATDGTKGDVIERGVGDQLLKEANTAHHPVDSVSWNEANEFCRSLGDREGRTYRLPTEAEWEWVCRDRGAVVWTAVAPNDLWKEAAWLHVIDGVIVRSPGPVGSRSPNDVGVYDMFGNVAEWCSDYYSPTYYSEAAIDPQGPTTGSKRVIRGGAFDTSPPSEIVHRTSLLPTERRLSVGFRVVVDLSKDFGKDATLRGIQAKYGIRPK